MYHEKIKNDTEVMQIVEKKPNSIFIIYSYELNKMSISQSEWMILRKILIIEYSPHQVSEYEETILVQKK